MKQIKIGKMYDMDPVLANALATFLGALTIAVLTVLRWYFPDGFNRFGRDSKKQDEKDESEKKKKHKDVDETDPDLYNDEDPDTYY